MKVQLEEITPVKKKLHIQIPKERVSQEFDLIIRELGKKAKIRGFRPGKVPRSILEHHYRGHITIEVMKNLVGATFKEAVDQHGLKPVSEPELGDGVPKPDEDFLYTATFEVRPPVEVDNYTSLDIEVETREVTDQDVEKQLESLRERFASLKEIEGRDTLKDGDYAVVDYKGTVDGKGFKGSDGDGYLIGPQAEGLYKEFMQALKGLKVGEQKTIEYRLPEGLDDSQIAGRLARFDVTLRGIKQKVLPELDDEFAKDMGNYGSLEELRAAIRANLEAMERNRYRESLENKIKEELLKSSAFEVPASMVEREIASMVDRLRRRLSEQGLTLEKIGKSPEQVREDFKEEAVRRIKFMLVLEAIANKESIEVTEEDVQKALVDLSKGLNKDVEEVRKAYTESGALEGLKVRLREDKTLDFLIAKAKIKEVKQEKNSG